MNVLLGLLGAAALGLGAGAYAGARGMDNRIKEGVHKKVNPLYEAYREDRRNEAYAAFHDVYLRRDVVKTTARNVLLLMAENKPEAFENLKGVVRTGLTGAIIPIADGELARALVHKDHEGAIDMFVLTPDENGEITIFQSYLADDGKTIKTDFIEAEDFREMDFIHERSFEEIWAAASKRDEPAEEAA